MQTQMKLEILPAPLYCKMNLLIFEILNKAPTLPHLIESYANDIQMSTVERKTPF